MTSITDVLTQIDDAVDDWTVSADAMRCGAPPGVGHLGYRGGYRGGAVETSPLGSLTVELAEALNGYDRDSDDRRHHPPPLHVDRHDYRRRVRARTRRRWRHR